MTKINLVLDIQEICKKFKFSELVNYSIIEDVFNVDIDDFNEQMNKYELNTCSAVQVASFIAETTKDCTIEELRENLNLLKVWDCALRSKNKLWQSHELLDRKNEGTEQSRNATNLRRDLIRSFRIKSLDALVSVISYQNLLWCAITGKKLTRRRGVKLEPTNFVCVALNSPYFFTSPNKFSAEKFERITHALNYDRVRTCNLKGKSIPSLLKMLQTKVKTNGSADELVLSSGIKIGQRYMETTEKNIQAYVDRCFDNNIELETLTVEVSEPWDSTDFVPEMQGEMVRCKMVIKSNNIAETLKYYASVGVIKPPLPDYIRNIQNHGKNYIKLRKRKRTADN